MGSPLRDVPGAREPLALSTSSAGVIMAGMKRKRSGGRIELGKHIVADHEICHGKPTFKGTRIMVWQVLDDVADGRSWDFICNERWGGRIPLAAIAEAVRLAQEALVEHYESSRRPLEETALV